MRIRELKIDRYGPLRDIALSGVEGLTLLHGANEEGKTLLIDAMVRLLFRKRMGQRVKYFGNMARVDESPEGYVVVEIDGREVKIDRNDSLEKHATITPDDFRNIFVVRDSDLSIVDEAAYLTDLTEKLTGLRTSEINRIKKRLQLIGCLTNPSSASDLANNAESGHMRRRMEVAEELSHEVRALADELDAEDFERYEQILAEKREMLERARRELDILKRGKLRMEGLEAQSNLEKLVAVRDELTQLAAFDPADFEAWTHHARDLKRLGDEAEDVRGEQATNERQVAEIEGALAKQGAVVDALRERARRIDDLIEPRIYEYEKLRDEGAGEPRRWLTWSAALAGAAFVASLVGAVIHPGFFFYVVVAVLGVVAAGIGLRLFRRGAASRKIELTLDDLKTQAARLGFDVTSIDDWHRAQSVFDGEHDEARRLLDGTRVSLGVHQKQLEVTQRRLRDIRGEQDRIERAITDIRTKSGVMELAEYHDALRRKSECVANRRYLETVLEKALGDGGEDKIGGWQRKVVRHLTATAGQDPVAYDAAREEVLIERIEAIEREVSATEDSLRRGRQALHDIETKVRNSGITSPENIVCRTSDELRALERQLEEFVRAVLERRDDALLAMKVFESIENEEKSRVVELFGEDRTVSTYFKRITDGRYTQVRFDPDDTTMSVRTQDDEWISADTLSGGALDQLYFAIRLSIAESIFGEDRGFFILDDPFVKSDIHRLENQLQLVKTLVAEGWQILYFSAKKEVRDLLKADVAAGRARLVSVSAARPEAAPPSSARVAQRSVADLFLDGPTY